MMFDVIVALVIAYGFYVGYSRGIIKTVFDTLSILVAIIASLKLSPILIRIIDSTFNLSPAIGFIAGIVLTFILVMAIVRFIGRKLEGLFRAVRLNFINKLAGGLFQGLFFAVILSFAVHLGDKIGLVKESTKEESMSYSLLEPLPDKANAVFENLKPMFSEFWNKTMEVMEEVKNDTEK